MKVRIISRAGSLQNVGKRNACPFRITDRTRRPRIARDRCDLKHIGSPVAGTLHDGRHRAVRKTRAKLGHRQVQRTLNQAIDHQTMLIHIQQRDVAMTSNRNQAAQ